MTIPGKRIIPTPITAGVNVKDLVDNFMSAYNGARLREACQVMAQKIMQPGVTVGLTITGALTPAGIGYSCVVPLIEAGLIDWIVSTGANLYHDIHYSLGFALYSAQPNLNDMQLREDKIIRIYDILFDQEVLLKSDAFLRRVMKAPEFQRKMGTAEMHAILGKYVRKAEDELGTGHRSILSAAYACGVPIYTSSPGDSTLGMNVAAMRLEGSILEMDVERDVNESSAIVYDAKASGGQSAVIILGGGSPKNFALQTEPHIQEILGIPEAGHDYFVQFTDARPDTGGLSGATPSEAMTWGKIDPEQLPDTVVCYADSTICFPIAAGYVLSAGCNRPLKRLYDRRESLYEALRAAYQVHKPSDEI